MDRIDRQRTAMNLKDIEQQVAAVDTSPGSEFLNDLLRAYGLPSGREPFANCSPAGPGFGCRRERMVKVPPGAAGAIGPGERSAGKSDQPIPLRLPHRSCWRGLRLSREPTPTRLPLC